MFLNLKTVAPIELNTRPFPRLQLQVTLDLLIHPQAAFFARMNQHTADDLAPSQEARSADFSAVGIYDNTSKFITVIEQQGRSQVKPACWT